MEQDERGSFQITVDRTICEQVFKQKRHFAYGKKSVQAEHTPKTQKQLNKYFGKHSP